MNPVESLRMSLRAIRGHRLRSLLTTLGIAIGVAAVITFVTLGASLQADVLSQVAGRQTPSMTVTAGPADAPPGPSGPQQAVFTEHDVAEIRNLTGVTDVIPTGTVPVSGLVVDNRTVGYNQLTASTPAFFDYRTDAGFVAGEAFEPGAHEVVINQPALALFDGNVSIGERVVLLRSDGSRVNATLVGVLDTNGGPFGDSAFPEVYVPTDPFYGNTL